MSTSEQSNASSSQDESDEDPIESLVVGRAKRVTAGNRLSSLVEKEQDDDIELLFAENELEEDESFDEDEDDASDANLESSTSGEEDGEGANVGDEMAGEKELQKQDRQESKKRKARDKAKMPGMVRKKVKIDPTAIHSSIPAPPRPKKKSERVSWVATAADAPTRISSRKQTIQNREVVHQRLVNSEKQRIKVMRQMEEAQKRKDATKPKALTQAQRLEDAAKMERKNAKSLSRWEESEKKRAADEKAKLEALHNRQLSGPVISWWSGLARWLNGKIAQLGVKEIRDSGNKEGPAENVLDYSVEGHLPREKKDLSSKNIDTASINTSRDQHDQGVPQQQAYQTYSQSTYSQPIQFTTPQGPYGFLDGIHAYAALPVQQQRAEFTGTADSGALPPSSLIGTHSYQHHHGTPSTPARKEPETEFSSRTLIALKNMDANTQRLPEIQNSVLVKKHKTKPQSVLPLDSTLTNVLTEIIEASPEQCAITGQLAKFRDPKTSLPYANSYAYKEIQRLGNGGSRWSDLLDCYVGSSTTAARGVPERFWKQG